MGRLCLERLVWAAIAASLFCSLPACGGHKPAGTSPIPAKITLNPATSLSLQAGSIQQLFASAQNSSNGSISPVFTFSSTNTNVVDVSPTGIACGGVWNAPAFTVCTPNGSGTAQITASALGATSAPTLVFVHPPIDNIKISVVPPVNSPPPACPTQQALPAACNIAFNPKAANFCMSQNQLQTLQATAFSGGSDITAQVGPFTWTQVDANVAKITPIVTVNSYNVATNQATAEPNAPGQTQVIASASGTSSQPFDVETCPVQCIDLQIGDNGQQNAGITSFVVSKGTSETITATAVDVQGCIVPKPPLTWISSAPAALTAGSGTTGCPAGTTCAVTTAQPGSATITASCTPPTCNIGWPLNPEGFPAPYAPQPVYPVTSISGIVTGTPGSTSVLATTRDCSTDILCSVGLYNVSSSTNLQGSSFQLPTPPNSLLYDAAGDKAYSGSDFGAIAINPANLGGSSSPFTSLPASGTSLGLVTGKVLAISPNGNFAVFSDTVSTPNQVYLVSTASSPASSTALNIDGATAAAFSPDGLKVFILGNGGNTLNIYSPLESLAPPIALPSPATSVAFNSTGSFALLAGGGSAGNLAAYNTCDSSAVSLAAGGVPGPPLFLKMVPWSTVPLGSTFGNIIIPASLDRAGLDFFFGLDKSGIAIIATSSSLVPLPLPAGQLSPTTLCPHPLVLAQTMNPAATFAPVYINIGQGTFHPVNFFLSPDTTRAYIITSDRGVLIYDFNINSVSAIPLINNATPVAADMSVDGSLLYIAGSDGLLHQINTSLFEDQNQTSFSPLPNSSNNFCYTGTNCTLNLLAVKP